MKQHYNVTKQRCIIKNQHNKAKTTLSRYQKKQNKTKQNKIL